MVRVLAVSDEVDERLSADPGLAAGAQLILSCGDMPFDYLQRLMDALDIPLVFVPGNHDPELGGYRTAHSGLVVRAGLPATAPWPPGSVNADARVVDVAGLRIAGLGGSVRYREGPNQYTQRQQARRARRLARQTTWRRLRDRRGVDVLLTHSPPRGLGDADDLPHRGFEALHPLAHQLRVPLLLHGHIHPFGQSQPDRFIDATTVRNVVGRHLFDIPAVGEHGRTANRIPEV